MLNNEFKKSATEKLKSMDSHEFKKAFKTIGSELQTNEEWFCQLSTEEKAEVILKKTTELRLERKWSERYIEEWLKEMHNEKHRI